jgi:hypothetical protein
MEKLTISVAMQAAHLFIILFITLLSSCNANNTSDLSKEEIAYENINELTESSLLGAWKYEDSYFGEVFIQFEKDRVVKVLYNYEGDVFLEGKWEYKDNIINLSDVVVLDKLLVSDYDGNSFKIPSTSYDSLANTNKKYIVINRLKDVFEPMIFLLNNRERYGNNEENVSSVIEENSNYNNSRTIQKQWVNCKDCHGKGREICYRCNGTGQGECSSCNGKGISYAVSGAYTCNQCNGRGVARCSSCNGQPDRGDCQTCDGRGQVKE